MWEQYKKTFLRMQLVIFVVCAAIYLRFTHAIVPILPFFLILQAGSLAGASWGAQLRKKYKPNG